MATPTTTTQYQTGIAPELQPYAQSLLGQSLSVETAFTANVGSLAPPYSGDGGPDAGRNRAVKGSFCLL